MFRNKMEFSERIRKWSVNGDGLVKLGQKEV